MTRTDVGKDGGQDGGRDLGRAASWDARYSAEPAPFGDVPSVGLVMALARLSPPPRRALMLADGDGRNGSWLASRGVAVTAVELSPVATALALERDRRAGRPVTRVTADLAGWRPKPRSFDLAAIVFLHGPETLRSRTLMLAAEALAPGGWLFVEGFAQAQAAGRLGPDDPDKLIDLAQITDSVRDQGLELEEALEGRVRLSDGPRHRGEAVVARLLARVPGGG